MTVTAGLAILVGFSPIVAVLTAFAGAALIPLEHHS